VLRFPGRHDETIYAGCDPIVLITGGSEGIGRALAVQFHRSGARVLVTGRSADKLGGASSALPKLETFVSDISRPDEREQLAQHVREVMPGLNILINNAGIQRRVSLAADAAPWSERQIEIDTLLGAPVHLNHLLVPVILAQGGPGMIVNVTSGGAYVPQPFAPIYSACKAALHSYTMNLRFALANTPCRVVEIIPPAIRTALAGPGDTHGAPLEEFCDVGAGVLRLADPKKLHITAAHRQDVTPSSSPSRSAYRDRFLRNP
jgi:uncharacterized oxidoreductase